MVMPKQIQLPGLFIRVHTGVPRLGSPGHVACGHGPRFTTRLEASNIRPGGCACNNKITCRLSGMRAMQAAKPAPGVATHLQLQVCQLAAGHCLASDLVDDLYLDRRAALGLYRVA